jgi:hypothetical protein
VQNGEFSERSLAKILGISQPQLHNVLKGARGFRTPLADTILAKLRLSILDLLAPTEFRPYDALPSIPRKQPASAAKLSERNLKAS